jgi:hypothetical protein
MDCVDMFDGDSCWACSELEGLGDGLGGCVDICEDGVGVVEGTFSSVAALKHKPFMVMMVAIMNMKISNTV